MQSNLLAEPPPSTGPAQQASAPAPTAAAPPPVAQVGQALATLHVAPSASGHVSIRLDPQELGGVQIELRRGQDGTAALTLTVERPETLRALQAEISHLHQALDRAGVPAEQRSVTLHLAPAADQAGSTQADGSGQSFQGEQRSAQQHQAGGRSSLAPGAAQAGPDAEPDQPPPRPQWARAGFDITA